jgi:hypothetical protein
MGASIEKISRKAKYLTKRCVILLETIKKSPNQRTKWKTVSVLNVGKTSLEERTKSSVLTIAGIPITIV